MLQTHAIDSVVLQVSGDDLKTAKEIEVVLGGKLDILKCSPTRPTKEGWQSWKSTTGRNLPSTAVFIALLYHPRGQAIPLVRYGNGKGIELHFHGLQQYEHKELVLTDGAIQRRAILDEFLSEWDKPIKLSRFDRSIDFIGLKWCDYSNTRQHRKLVKKRGIDKEKQFKKTTVYYQSPKPKYTKVTAYDKQGTKDKLRYPLTRIEFSFMGQFWRNSEAIHPSKIIEMATDKADTYIKRLFR